MGILIVDDSRIERMILKELLESEGYTVDASENGEEAFQSALVSLPDLIISDILMPVMDGFSLCKAIRSDERTAHVPFVFYTSTYIKDGDEALGVKIGADGFFRRPMEWDDFYPAITAIMKGAAKKRRIPRPLPDAEEGDLYKLYNERLIKKLEDKVLELEKEVRWRKETTGEIKRREALLNKIFDVLPVGLWFADPKGKLLRGNPAGIKIWGAEPKVPVEEYGVFKARRLPSGEEIPPEDWALARTIREGVTVKDELLEIDAFDGQKRVILNYTAPVLDDNGGLQGAIVVNQDITRRQRAEEEQEKLQARLIQAQKMESVGRLAGGVAHDFNNMLGIVLGYTELAMEKVDPAHPIFADLQEVRKAAERSSDLTRQLLAFARQQTSEPEVLDLNATVEGMLKMLHRLIGENIHLAWKPQTGLWPVKIDPGQIDQILANLCVNARDAIDGTGRFTVETENADLGAEYCAGHPGFVPGEYVSLIVSDDGRGMDRETAEKIFEPFFTTKDMGKGTGLGLSTVYGIVKQNNGFIYVYSEPGQGTTFKIHLPRYKPTAVEMRPEEPSAPAAKGHETILLVEDEPAILKMGKRMLERLGYRVLAAVTPMEAMELAQKHAGEIHLLMTDVIMPEMNGRDLAKNLMSFYPDMKRLFMSGYTADVIAHQGGIDEGGSFIRKPFSIKDLGAKLRETLEG